MTKPNDNPRRRTAMFVSWYDLDAQSQLSGPGKKYPRHHLWGFDRIGCCISIPPKKSFINSIGKSLRLTCLRQQLFVAFNQRNFDQTFVPLVEDGEILALLRWLRIFRKSLFGVAHHSMTAERRTWARRVLYSIRRFVILQGFDRILFLNEHIYQQAKAVNRVPSRHNYIKHWGVDNEYYVAPPAEAAPAEPTSGGEKLDKDYFFCTGKTNRDFASIIAAFQQTNAKLLMQTRAFQGKDNNFPSNISVDNRDSLTDSDLIKNYKHCTAVLVPLKRQDDFPTGITVIFEAFTLGKPVIATNNTHYPFDIEKEGCGLLVDHGDIEGWRNAVNWISLHPEKAQKMGERGRELVNTRFNYSQYCKEVENLLSDGTY